MLTDYNKNQLNCAAQVIGYISKEIPKRDYDKKGLINLAEALEFNALTIRKLAGKL